MFWLPFLAVAAVSAGASLIGGLAARSAAEDQQDRAEEEARRVEAANRAENERVTQSNRAENERITQENRQMADEWYARDHAGRLVREAESAGFNPLTVLRAGGLSAYAGVAQSAIGASVSSPVMEGGVTISPTPQILIPNAGMAIADAFQSAASVMGGAVSQNASFQHSSSMLDKQLNHDSLMQGQRLAASAANNVSRSGSGALSAAPYPADWERGDVTVTNPHFRRNVDPTSADGETYQQRYGEYVGGAMGIIPVVDDAIFNATGTTAEQRVQTRIQRQNDYLAVINRFWGGLHSRPLRALPDSSFGPMQPGMGSW